MRSTRASPGRSSAKLARKRPSPLQSGRAETWAGGVLWALGQVNFLFDRSTEPYLTHDDLADAFGLSKSTLGQGPSRYATR